MNGKKNSSSDYRLLVEEDLWEEFSDEISQPSSSSTSASLRSLKLKLPWHVFRIPFRHAIRIVLFLPFFAFVFAVVWAVCTDYEKAVNVLCTKDDNRKVRNYLPSLSAATGDFPISQALWTICIVIHAPPRFLFGSMYLKYFEAIVPPSYQQWAFLAWVISVLEVLGLVGLSVITSRQNLTFHAICFATFLISSELYMLLQCILQSSRMKTKSQGPSCMEAKSLTIKKCLTKTVVLCTGILIYTYFRHETYCEEGIYTIFAAVEYVIILSNMMFHGCSYWDFYDRVIVIDLCRPFLTSNTNTNGMSWSF